MINARNLMAFAGVDEEDLVETAPEPTETDQFPTEERYLRLSAMLGAHMEVVEDVMDEVDPDALTDLDGPMDRSDETLLKEGLASLDPDCIDIIAAALDGGITQEAASVIGLGLEAQGDTDDGTRLAGWLFRIGQLG